MNVTCPQCRTVYRLPDDKAKAGAKLRCSVCRHVFSLPEEERMTTEEALSFGSGLASMETPKRADDDLQLSGLSSPSTPHDGGLSLGEAPRRDLDMALDDTVRGVLDDDSFDDSLSISAQEEDGRLEEFEEKKRGRLDGAFSLLLCIGLIFGGGICCKTNGIAEVVSAESGHYSIEVDNRKSLVGVLVVNDVVALGVVVGDALRDNSGFEGTHEGGTLIFEAVENVQLGGDIFQSSGCIIFCSGPELLKTFRGVVEILDGLMETLAGEIRKVALELSERFCDLVRLFGSGKRVEAVDIFHEVVGSPVIAVLIEIAGNIIRSFEQTERFQTLGRFSLFYFFQQMGGDAVDVFHHVERFGENIVVDALESVMFDGPVAIGCDFVGVIDMTASKRDPIDKTLFYTENSGERLKFFFAYFHILYFLKLKRGIRDICRRR